MPTFNTPHIEAVPHWVRVRPAQDGRFTAQAVGLPDICATAATRAQAIQAVKSMLTGLVASGELESVDVPLGNPLLKWAGRADPNDPHEQEYVRELARSKQEDLEETLRELDKECSSTSSIPTI